MTRRPTISRETDRRVMTAARLTALLAERVFGWRSGPDRFLAPNRSWTPRDQFRPTERVHDAFKLLLAAGPAEYSMGGGSKGGLCWAKVRIGGTAGEASASSIPAAICIAIAIALGIQADLTDLHGQIANPESTGAHSRVKG